LVFAGKEVWCNGVLTAQGVSHTVILVSGCIVTQALYVRLTYVVRDPLTELSRCWRLWLHCRGRAMTATPLCLHYSIACMDKCKSWLSSNRTAGLSSEGLACATKCFACLTDDPPSSTQMNGPSVKSVLKTVFVRCFLRQPVVPCCSVLPKYEMVAENPSPRSLLTFHIVAQLSHLVAGRQAVCCCCLTSSCKYALFSFLKGKEKCLTVKRLNNKLSTQSAVS